MNVKKISSSFLYFFLLHSFFRHRDFLESFLFFQVFTNVSSFPIFSLAGFRFLDKTLWCLEQLPLTEG
jgi:hypothetical protein